MRLIRMLLLFMAATLVVACADDDNLNQPTELVPFDSKYFLEVTWHTATGAGVEQQYVFLHPLILKETGVTVSRDGLLTVTSIKTGDEEYTVDLERVISAGVGGDEDVWLVASNDAHIIAVDRKSRSQRWSTRVPTEVLALSLIHI